MDYSVKHNLPPAKILVVTDFIGLLTKERIQVGVKGGFEVHLFAGNFENIEGVKAYSISRGKHPKWTWIKRAFYVRHLIRKIKPDLVHVLWANQFFMNIVLSRFRPLVVTVMGGDFLPERLQKFPGYVRKLINLLLNRAQVVTSKSEFMDKALQQRGIPTEKIRRITWGVNLDIFKPGLPTEALRRELDLPEKAFIFFSHRLGKPLYCHKTIIKAFALLRGQKNRDAYLLVVSTKGQDSYIEELKIFAKKEGVEAYIRFLPEIPHQQMPYYYNLAKSAISIPLSDGMPQSLYETMACGCFHILGDLPQYKELIRNGESGLFVPLNNPEKLCAALNRVMDHPLLLRKAAALNRKRCREVADKKKETAKMNAIYAELISRYPRQKNKNE